MTTITEAERKARAALPLTRLFTAYMPLSLAQWIIDKSVQYMNMPQGITRETIDADGVRADWLIPDGSPAERVLLYLHGGGFIYGASTMHYQMVATLAKQMNTRALMVDYRLAPEYPFPVPLDDCVTAYRWLLKQGVAADKIVIAGDSAGGNLTITTMMQLRDAGDPLPVAAAGLSPVIDLSNKGAEFKAQHDPMLHPKAARFMNQSYIGQSDPHNPLISPAFGDWTDLPPMLIHAGEDEILRNDAQRIDDLMMEYDFEATIEIYPRMWHVWQISSDLPQTKDSLNKIANFLCSYLESAH